MLLPSVLQNLAIAIDDPVGPVFGRDLSFYLLALPLYDDVVEITIGILCVVIALWAAIGMVARSGTAAFAYRPNPFGASYPRQSVALLNPSRAVWVNWLRQGMALGALLCIAFGASRFLSRYHLVLEGHSKVVAGASYADVNFWLPGYDLIIACWFAAALILGLAAARPRIRNWLLMRQSHRLAPLAALAVLFMGAFVVPTSFRKNGPKSSSTQ